MSECPLTLRVLKGSALTHAELDNNFLSLKGCITNLQTQIDNIGPISGETLPYVFITGSTESIVPNTGGGNTMTSIKPFSSVLGGSNNSIVNASRSSIGGGTNNSITSAYFNEITSSFIGSGGYNVLFANRSSIVTGLYNEVSGQISYKGDTIPSYGVIIGSGSNNRIISSYNSSVLGGGQNKLYTSSSSSILSGWNNKLYDGIGSDIIGGYNNRIDGGGWTNTIVGGYANKIINRWGNFIGGGGYNNITGGTTPGTYSQYNSILGGITNKIHNANYSTIIGGKQNKVLHSNSHIIGSNITTISANTTYVESLNIKTVTTGSTSSEVLVRESNGIINTKQIITENTQQSILYLTSTGTTYSDGRSPVASGILNIGLNPIELLPTPGINKYYDIERIIMEYTATGTEIASPCLKATDGLSTVFTCYPFGVTNVSNVIKTFWLYVDTTNFVVSDLQRYENQSINLTTLNGLNPDSSIQGSLKITIKYVIRTFGS